MRPDRGLVFIIGAAALTLRDVPRRDQLPAPAEIDDLLFSCDAAPRAAAAGGGGDGPARAYQVIGLVDSGTNWVRELIAANCGRDAADARARPWLGAHYENKHRFEHVSKLGARAPSLDCLLYTSPSPRDRQKSRMPSSA